MAGPTSPQRYLPPKMQPACGRTATPLATQTGHSSMECHPEISPPSQCQRGFLPPERVRVHFYPVIQRDMKGGESETHASTTMMTCDKRVHPTTVQAQTILQRHCLQHGTTVATCNFTPHDHDTSITRQLLSLETPAHWNRRVNKQFDEKHQETTKRLQRGYRTNQKNAFQHSK